MGLSKEGWWYIIIAIIDAIKGGHEAGYWETDPNGKKVWVKGDKPSDPVKENS